MSFCPSSSSQTSTVFSKKNASDHPSPNTSSRRGRKTFRCTFSETLLQASLTIECALTLPLFIMACTVLLLLVSLPGRCAEEMLDLSNKARQMAVYSSALGGAGAEWIDLPSFVTQKVPFFSQTLRVPVRARCRVWAGADEGTLSSASAPASGSDALVYVTDHESVYHTHADCTHLDLTIFATDTEHVGSLRNIYGERYRKCDGFPAGYTGSVYVTSKGDRYYPSTDYGGLTRHVHLVSSSETGGLPLCERCAAKDAAAAGETAAAGASLP